jgi:hypothetical protein
MHASFRRIKTKPGQASKVAELIRTEYLPMIDNVDGFVSYTLVDLGDDEISSIGIFTTSSSADAANATARSWTAQRLSPYVDSPLEARAGAVLVDHRPATT